MGKRGADVELTSDNWQNADAQFDEDNGNGTWLTASESVIKQRKIVTATRKRPAGGQTVPLPPAGNPFATAFGNAVAPVTAPAADSSKPNPFAVAFGANAASDNKPKKPEERSWSNLTTTSDNPTNPTDPVHLARQSSVSSGNQANTDTSKGTSAEVKFQALNKQFHDWVVSEMKSGPRNDWSAALKDYIRYADKIVSLSASTVMSESAPAKPAGGISFGAPATNGGVAVSTPKSETTSVLASKPSGLFGGAGSEKNDKTADKDSKAAAPMFAAPTLPQKTDAKPAVPFNFGAPSTASSPATTTTMADTTTTAPPLFNFGAKPGAGSDETAKPLFGAPAAAPAAAPGNGDDDDALVIPDEPATKVEATRAGEEDEDIVHEQRAKVFVMGKAKEGGEKPTWGELGVGQLQINKNKKTGKVRILMRTEPLRKVVINSPLTGHFKFEKKKNNIQTSLHYPKAGKEEAGFKLSLIRTKNEAECDKLLAALNEHKTA